MIQESPTKRPSAAQILAQPVICPSTQKSKVSLNVLCILLNYCSFPQAQLCKELNEEKFKNQLLTRCVFVTSDDVQTIHLTKSAYHRYGILGTFACWTNHVLCNLS